MYELIALVVYVGRTLVFKMELYSRNTINVLDDNVESLTDNADGNDVGIEQFLAAREQIIKHLSQFWYDEDVLQTTNKMYFLVVKTIVVSKTRRRGSSPLQRAKFN